MFLLARHFTYLACWLWSEGPDSAHGELMDNPSFVFTPERSPPPLQNLFKAHRSKPTWAELALQVSTEGQRRKSQKWMRASDVASKLWPNSLGIRTLLQKSESRAGWFVRESRVSDLLWDVRQDKEV
uniref:Uncharacterized protein n=1 Tax=Poecilia latipinna TaxID=48699 RepID=A0A3B3V1A5_9TELE